MLWFLFVCLFIYLFIYLFILYLILIFTCIFYLFFYGYFSYFFPFFHNLQICGYLFLYHMYSFYQCTLLCYSGNRYQVWRSSMLSYEKIRRYNNVTYMTVRWLPQQIPPLNFPGKFRYVAPFLSGEGKKQNKTKQCLWLYQYVWSFLYNINFHCSFTPTRRYHSSRSKI